MSVRKRKWKTAKGVDCEAWVVDYVDQAGERHIQTFERKKDADDYHSNVRVDGRNGLHTPRAKSITVGEAANDWISYIQAEGRERSTVEQYSQHIRVHISPRIGREKLGQLTAPRINAFRDELL